MFGITEPTPNSSCLKISYGSGSCFLQKWSILGRVSSKNQLHLPGWTYRSRLVAVFAFITGGDGLRVLEQQSRSMLHISCSSVIFRVVPHIFEWPTTTHHIADQLFQSFFTHFPYSNFLRMSMMAVQFFLCPVRLLIIPLSPAWVFTTGLILQDLHINETATWMHTHWTYMIYMKRVLEESKVVFKQLTIQLLVHQFFCWRNSVLSGFFSKSHQKRRLVAHSKVSMFPGLDYPVCVCVCVLRVAVGRKTIQDIGMWDVEKWEGLIFWLKRNIKSICVQEILGVFDKFPFFGCK